MSTSMITPGMRTATDLVRPEVRRPVRQLASARGPVARPVRRVPRRASGPEAAPQCGLARWIWRCPPACGG